MDKNIDKKELIEWLENEAKEAAKMSEDIYKSLTWYSAQGEDQTAAEYYGKAEAFREVIKHIS